LPRLLILTGRSGRHPDKFNQRYLTHSGRIAPADATDIGPARAGLAEMRAMQALFTVAPHAFDSFYTQT
jgi:hypothetical protein